MSDGAQAGTDVTVLICDDAAQIRELLTVIVEEHAGLRVVGCAATGREAIDEAERVQPDVILLDISMPVLSGLEAIPELKRVARNAKIVALSGFASEELAEEVLAQGADRFVEKGVHPDVIVATIEAAARRVPDQFVAPLAG